MDNGPGTRAQAMEAAEHTPVARATGPHFNDVVEARYSRRALLRGATAVAAAALAPPAALLTPRAARAGSGGFGFTELDAGVDADHRVAEGYEAQVLIRWGDPVTPGAPPFDPQAQTAERQERQFGYNNDFVGYVPLPVGSENASHGLLFVNHEYTNEELMFPGLGTEGKVSAAQVDIEMAAHGGTVVEIVKAGGQWAVVPDSRFNRRISARSTAMAITGPAAGHARMKTGADPAGARVMGTLNNCAGGVTPWGTWLMAEENFHGYFRNRAALDGHEEERNFRRYGVPGDWYSWGEHHDRFDISKEPNEANRFGWIVEVDPLDPAATPKKRTALGRFKHEGAETIVNADGRVIVYSGDDQRGDYVYKFVSFGRYDPHDRSANMDLLEYGELFVAQYQADGRGRWLPLKFDAGPLTPENGFASQADVVIEARIAADLMGATPMDRPEDVEPSPVTQKVYVALTDHRTRDETNPANPRTRNRYGHTVEMTPDGGDHAAPGFAWDILFLAGDPMAEGVDARYGPGVTANGWFTNPDNLAIDPRGRLWVATDGNSPSKSGRNDGVWAVETEGEDRGAARHFYSVPYGAEMCGPRFTPDGRTLFVAVQHPADGGRDMPGFERASVFDDPATRWPDFADDMPPRPSVVAITRRDGGEIG